MGKKEKAKRQAQPATPSARRPEKSGFPRLLTLPLAFMVAGVLVGGGWFYRSHGRDMKREAEQNLLAIAELKAEQISQWRAERLGDAFVVMESPFSIGAIAQWMNAPEASLTDKLLSKFRSLKENYLYSDVMLVDLEGQVRFSLSGYRGPLTGDDQKVMADALGGRRPVLTDLHRGLVDPSPHIDVIAPLFAQMDNVSEPVGAIILRNDAGTFLYPLIQSWPTPSRSAETQLVRREEDSVVFLNELRHQTDAALKLRLPLSRVDAPAVMAALGKEGIVQGKDYRGVPVVAALKPIPDSGWFMVTKIDEREALAHWRFSSALLIILILGILAIGTTGLLAFWQRNEKANYRALFKAEAARRESEERFRTTVMSIGDGVITTDAAGRVEIMNPVAEALTGWKQEEARLRPLEEVFHIINEETRQEVENPVRRVVREGVVVGLANHTLLISRDGREYALADCGAPIRDEAGEITGVALVFRDQTAERAAERALRQSEEKYRSLAESSQDAIYLVDENGRFLFANNMYLSRFGLKSDQVVGRSYGEFHPAADTDEFMEKLQQVLGTGRWVSYEHRSHRDNRLFLRTLSPVRGTAEDRTIAATVVSKDVTAYKQTEEELRNSEDRFRMIFEFAPDAYYLSDLLGNFIDGNRAAEDITGYKREELIGKNFLTLNLLLPEEIYKAAELLARNAGGEATGPDEFTLLRQDGSRVLVEIMTYPVKIKGETAVLGIARDITRRKQDEDKLRATLREREVMLREIHHRVKNNIQIISSLLRLQAQHVGDDKVREILNESQSRIRSMALIHEKLYQSQDFARIDFSDYIAKMVTHLFAMFNLPSDRVRFAVEAENIQLDINRAIPCGLIINELVTNGLKHAFPGERKGELIVRMYREDGDHYQLSVKDNGVGLPRGFDPEKQKTLGFQIVRDLVRQLNGSIEFRKEEGTKIIIRF